MSSKPLSNPSQRAISNKQFTIEMVKERWKLRWVDSVQEDESMMFGILNWGEAELPIELAKADSGEQYSVMGCCAYWSNIWKI